MRLWTRNRKTNIRKNKKRNRSRIASAVLSLTLLSSVLWNAIASNQHRRYKDKTKQEIIVHQEDEQKYLKKIKNLTEEVKDLQEKSQKSFLERNQEISLVKKKFIKYNPEIEEDFINLFISVVDTYDLRGEGIDYFISQLLTESHGQQRHVSTHKLAGKVVRGTSGEVGVSQIMPGSAVFYFNRIKNEDKKVMIKLGATDFSWVKTKSDAIRWLSDTENNVILWGYIMRYNLNRTHQNVVNGFVAYNKGFGGLNKMIKKGQSPRDYWYYQRIQKYYSKIHLIHKP